MAWLHPAEPSLRLSLIVFGRHVPKGNPYSGLLPNVTGMTAYFSRLPSECATTNMSKALYARLLCHELLPRDVERAIAIDLGDILVFDDIRGLWDLCLAKMRKVFCLMFIIY